MQRSPSSRSSLLHHTWKYVLLGLLTVAPLWVTWLVFDFVLGLLRRFGAPAVNALMAVVAPHTPTFAAWVANPVVRSTAAVLFTLLGLWLIGLAASRVVGRRLIEGVEALLERIPLVQAVYGGTKRFITAMWRPETTGRQLAAVYVPTAPNPTSGYIEIVPLDEVVYIDWTVEQVMSFVVTGGANAPAGIRFRAHRPDGATID